MGAAMVVPRRAARVAARVRLLEEKERAGDGVEGGKSKSGMRFFKERQGRESGAKNGGRLLRMSDGGGRCCEGLPVAQAQVAGRGRGSQESGRRWVVALGRGSWGGKQASRARLALELLTVTLLCRRDRQTAEKCEMAKADCAVSLPWFMCRCEHEFVESISRNGVVARRLLQVAWSAWAPVPSCSRQDHV